MDASRAGAGGSRTCSGRSHRRCRRNRSRSPSDAHSRWISTRGTDTAAANVPLDPAGRIVQDVPCLRCGYNLRSLLPGKPVPECGAAVGPSLRGDELRFSDPQWLARLVRGDELDLGRCSPLCGGPVGPMVRRLALQPHGMVRHLALHAGVLSTDEHRPANPHHLWHPGPCIRLVTLPEPGRIVPVQGDWIRIVARAQCGWLPSTDTSGCNTASASARQGPANPSHLWWTSVRMSLWCLLSTSGWVAFCIHLSFLGRRAGAIRLRWFTLLASVGVTLLGLILSGISIWLTLHMQRWFCALLTIRLGHCIRLISLVLTLRQSCDPHPGRPLR